MYTYYCESFDNFEEFAEDNEDLAELLLSEVRPGAWQDNEIRVYPDIESYAEYQLYDGFYASLFIGGSPDWNCRPNLFDYLDMRLLGEDFYNTADSSTVWTDGEVIVETDYGWWKYNEETF